MARTERLHLIPDILPLIPGVTHLVEPIVYGTEGHVIGAAAFGVIYRRKIRSENSLR